MESLGKAVGTFADTVTSKLGDFARRQRTQAEELASIKSLLEAGRQMESKADRVHREAFAAVLRDPGDTKALRRASEAAIESKVIGVGDATTGGLSVPKTIQVAIDATAATYCPWLDPSVLGLRQITSGDYRDVFTFGAAASRSAESGTRSATADPDFRSVAPAIGEYYCLWSAYSWALEDIADAEALLAAELGKQLGAQLAADVWSGSGASGQISGITAVTPESSADDASPQRTTGAIQYTTVTSSPLSLQLDDVATLLGTFAEEYLLSPEFSLVMRPSTWRTLCQAAGADAPFLMPAEPRLFGYRVHLTSALPAIAANALPVAAGAWRAGYVFGQRSPLQIMIDRVSSKGTSTFYGRARYAGVVRNSDAIKAVKITSA